MSALPIENPVPSPPPPPVEEHSGENFDPNLTRGLYRIWDIVAVFGPISRDDAFLKQGGMFQGSWQEYMRYHPGTKREDATRLDHDSNRWYFDHEIEIGTKNGYLKEENGLLSIGSCPSTHKPPSETAIKQMVGREDNLKALDLLRNKTDVARQKPTRGGRNRLRQSLQDVGQLYPIRRWRDGGDWIIVDGKTREELLEELGIEPRYEPVPSTLTALEVLVQRINHEIARSTKDESDTARNDYIAELAKQGFSQKSIAEKVGLTKMRVSQILSQSKVDFTRGQQPPPKEIVEEWIRRSDAGWSIRDIAEDYVWSKNTVSRWITKHREAAAAAVAAAATGTTTAPVVVVGPKYMTETKHKKFLEGLMSLGGLATSAQEAEDEASRICGERINHSGGAWTKLVEDGFVISLKPSGYEVTQAGREEYDFYPKRTPPPPAPTPPKKKEPPAAETPDQEDEDQEDQQEVVCVCSKCGNAHVAQS